MAKIWKIDVGNRHLVGNVRDAAYIMECKRRKVRFLPAQVTRRLVDEASFSPENKVILLNPFDPVLAEAFLASDAGGVGL